MITDAYLDLLERCLNNCKGYIVWENQLIQVVHRVLSLLSICVWSTWFDYVIELLCITHNSVN